jgi:hypothetical protein
MKKHTLNAMAAAILPLSLQAGVIQTAGSYGYIGQRAKSSATNYIKNDAYKLADNSQTLLVKPLSLMQAAAPNDELSLYIQENNESTHLIPGISTVNPNLELRISKNNPVNELVIIDQAVPDKHLFYKDLKPGTEVKEISSGQDGLIQLNQILSQYQNLEALHLVSHAADGVIYLGNTQVTEQLLEEKVDTFSSLNNALKENADLLLYGCNLAKTVKGEQLLELIAHEANIDVAASNDFTGNMVNGGDWEFEITKGDINTSLAFSEIALKDFSDVLAVYAPTDFCTHGGGYCATNASETSSDGYLNMTGDGTTINSYPLQSIIYTYKAVGYTNSLLTITAAGAIATFDLTAMTLKAHSAANCSSIIVTNNTNAVIETVASPSTDGDKIITVGTNTTGISSVKISISGCTNSNRFGLKSMSITPITNDDPTETGTFPTDITVVEDTASDLDLSGLTLADTDSAGDMPLTLTATGGTMAASDAGGVVIGGTGTGTLTLTGTVSEIDTYLNTASNIQYTSVLNDNGNDAKTIAVKINDQDGSGDIALGTFNVDITAVNDDPTETGTFPTDITVLEDTASDVDLSGLTLADVDAAASSVVVTLTSSAGTLAATSAGSVTVGGSATSTMTLTGTIANIDTYINTASNIKYTGASHVNGNDAATIAVKINDGGNTGTGGGGDIALGTMNMDITAANDLPTLAGTFTTAGTVNDDATTTPFSAVTVGDIEDAGDVYINITLSTAANGVISGTGITDQTGGVYQVSAGSIATVQTNLQAAVFTPTENQVTVTNTVVTTFTVASFDAGTGDTNSTTQVTATNTTDDAPTISGVPDDTVFKQVAANIDLAATTVADIDSASITATISVDTGGLVGASAGGAHGGGAIVVQTNGATLDVTGTPTQVNAYLNDTSEMSFTSAASTANVTVTVLIDDGTNSAVSDTSTITVIDGDSPTVGSGTHAGTEDTTVTGANLITASMAATQEQAATDPLDYITITAITGGSLSLTGSPTTTSVGGSSTALSAAGALSANDKIDFDELNLLSFTPSTDRTTDASITYTVTDYNVSTPDTSGTGTITISLSAVNDDPTGISEPASIAYVEETADDLDISAIVIDDVDSASLDLVLTVGKGTLAASNGGSVTVANSGTSAITLTGAPANIDTYLNTASNIQYTPVTDDTGSPATTLVITASDGDGASNINLATINMNISNVNDEPTITGTNDTATLAGGAGTAVVFSSTDIAINVTAKDAADAIESVVLTISNVTDTEVIKIDGSGDIDLKTSVGSTDLTNIAYSIVYSGSTSTITYTGMGAGTMTQSVINTALNGMTYENSVAAPTEADRVFVINQVVDNGSTGGSHDNTWNSANIFSTITVVDASKPTASNYTDSTTEDVAITVFSNTELPTIVDTATSDPIEYISIITGNITGGVLSLTGTPTGGTSTVGAITFDTAAGDLTGTVNIAIGDIGDLVFTPTTDLAGTGAASIIWTATDNAGHTSPTATYTLNITNTSDDPLGADKTIALLTTASHTFAASDFGFSDVDTGDALNRVRIDVQTLTGGTLKLSSVTVNDADWIALANIGNLVYAPTAAGSDTFTFTVEDDSDNSTDATPNTITFTVTAPVITPPPVTPPPVTPAPNSAPVFTSTAIMNAAAGTVYSYAIAASDIDDTALNIGGTYPSWLSLTDNGNGSAVLFGMPSNDNVGEHSVTLTVRDNDNASSTQSFTLTVAEGEKVNTAPVISGTPISSIKEGENYQFTPTVSDADKDDKLTFSLSGQPQWMSVNAASGVISGTPAQNDVEMTSNLTLTVNDNSGADNATDSMTFSVTVSNVNQAPKAVADNFKLNLNDSNTYVLMVLSNDSDLDGDAISITGANTSTGSVTTDGTSLTLTTQTGFVGQVQLIYTITDGHDTFAEGNVELLISGELSDAVPVVTVPAVVEVNATGLYTKVDLGVATAVSSEGQSIAISLVDNKVLFKPGNHVAYWQATDPSSGLTTVASQQVIVNPLISLGKNQMIVEGKTATVSVILNGEAPSYPLTTMLNITGNANDDDYVIASNQVTITSGTQVDVSIDIIQDNVLEGDETLTLSLGAGNTGSNASHVITIVERNVAPAVTLMSTQNNEARQVVTAAGGLVTVQATVTDANDDNVTRLWSYDNALNVSAIDDNTITLDPSELDIGVYPFTLTATDAGEGNLSTTTSIYVAVVESLAELSDADTDGDRIPDNEEGYSDADQDGIPDFQDAIDVCNVMPEQVATQNAFLIEGEPGVCLRKGNTLAAGETGGLELTTSDLENSIGADDAAVFVGGIFDYIATGLPEAGQSYQIVLPQLAPVPAGAVYRKYSENMGWGTFVENANNQLHSTAGTLGYCPPPASVLWTSGLTEGHWCVQLTLEDGGPNDNDGVANGTIVDPGGVSVLLTSNTMPVAVADAVSVKRNQSIVIDVLANDTDADQDSLSIGVATATFGTVTITADKQLHYQSADDFIGQDTIIYSLSDGNGGTDSSTVTVTVYANNAPIALDDQANTSDRTAITIDVLANDSDVDGDSLTVTSAVVDNGQVSINGDNTLTYKADNGFEGSALITYTIDDGQGEQASAQVTVTVKAVQVVTVKNKSKSGSMGTILIILAGFALYRSRSQHKLGMRRLVKGGAVIAATTSMNLAAAEPQWFLTGSVGKSHVSTALNIPSNIGAIESDVDKSDISYSLGGGVKYDTYSMTLSYEQLGEASASYTGETLDAVTFHQALANSAPKLVDGISLQGQYTLWQNDAVSASVGLGLFAWQLDYTSRVNDGAIAIEEDDIDVFYNVQISYQLTEHVEMSLKASRYNLSVNDVNNMALGLRYHF